MMTLHLLDNQSCSMVDAVSNMCLEATRVLGGEMEGCDHLRDCYSINSVENKDSKVTLSTIGISDISMEGSNLDDVNLINIDLNFMKIENLFVKHAEESEKCTEKKEEKQDKVLDINASELIESLDRVSPSCNTFSNLWRKETNDVKNIITNSESCMPNKDLTSQFSQRTLMIEYCDYSTIFGADNKDEDYSVNEDCISQNVTASELKVETKVDNQAENGQVQKCEQCLMTFRYKRHLDRHLEGHQKNNCPHCNEKFARRKHLAVHLFRVHGERMIVGHPHFCDVCSRSFLKRALLNRHRAKHSYESGKVCSDCGDMIGETENEKEHRENQCSKRRFTCQQCSQAFSNEQTYLSHIQNHNNYKCPNCNVGFASKRKAHEHFRAIHVAKSGDSDSTNSGPYFCTDCRHTFIKKDDYARHLESILHLGKVDRDTSPRTTFTCNICSKSLVTQKALDQHIRRIHKGKKRFVCNVYECTFQCARKTDLDRHKQLHVEKRNIVCEYCGKTFTSVSILKDHILYIHSKERQFICEKCGKAFKRNSLLKRHKLSHEQHRPFVCSQCSTAFKRSHHLTRHLEACHRITLERKKKMVKLMKTEDGHLVPVPEKSKRLKSCKTEMIAQERETTAHMEKDCLIRNMDKQVANVNSQQIQLSLNSENSKCPNWTLELTNLSADSIPQVLSILDVNTGQVLTVEVANPELTNNEFTDQYGTSETPNLPYYQDVDFQNNLLNVDQTYYDNTNYVEASLENIEGSLPLMNSNSKIETIDSYLTHEYPSFLNI